jgi:hypothetical protein
MLYSGHANELILSMEKRLTAIEQHLGAMHTNTNRERNRLYKAQLKRKDYYQKARDIAILMFHKLEGYKLIYPVLSRNNNFIRNPQIPPPPVIQRLIDDTKDYLQTDNVVTALRDERILINVYENCIINIKNRPREEKNLLPDYVLCETVADIFDSLGYPKFPNLQGRNLSL